MTEINIYYADTEAPVKLDAAWAFHVVIEVNQEAEKTGRLPIRVEGWDANGVHWVVDYKMQGRMVTGYTLTKAGWSTDLLKLGDAVHAGIHFTPSN